MGQRLSFALIPGNQEMLLPEKAGAQIR